MLLTIAQVVLSPILFVVVRAVSRTSPPSGAVVVNPSASSGQYSTLTAAVASLPNDGSSQVIFMYPGTYEEQVLIDRSGPLQVSAQPTSSRIVGWAQINIFTFRDTWVHGRYDGFLCK